MDRLTALIAGLIEMLRAAVAPELCPGGWPWAVSAFGVLVGLAPTAGAVAVAVVRRRIGSGYGFAEGLFLVGVGVVSAGLVPLLVFTATGQVFAAAAATGEVTGASSAGLAQLGEQTCLSGTQAEYLGGYTVAEAFGGGPVQLGLGVVLLVGVPLVAAMLVAAQARLALRRGPAWPSKFFWLPLLSLVLLTARTPAGSSGHLWLGVAVGSVIGIFVVLVVGVPSREVVRRSTERAARPDPRAAAVARRPTVRPSPPGAQQGQQQGQGQGQGLQRRDQAARPGAPRQPGLADRLAERFASRTPDPPVVVPSGTPAGAAGARPTGRAPNPPTLVAPGPPFAAAGGSPGSPRFRLVRRLGSGGFGRVWLAHDARLGHQVALKAAHAPDPETEERIAREARALAAVRHPNCVRIHDMLPARSDPGLSELDGMVLVMEFVDGMSLAELVRARGLLDDLFAARVWAGVAGALDAAHARGVMHRDVKPGNVVVDSAGLAHLIDFGIARRTGDATLTQAGFVLGTPDFLAPEVACGERATPASDAWQLAATVSYALTGQPPRGSHPDAVSGLRAAAVGAPLSRLPTRSAHLALLRASMDNDPARRPPLAVAQRALEDWLHRAGARPDGPVTAGRGR